MLKGSCLCGGVTFQADGTSRQPAACHCTQCRKQSGHHWASVQVDDDKLEIHGELRWFSSSPGAKRGFCPVCGSFLFWKAEKDSDTGVSLGSMDGSTGLHLERHIFTADKGDYYDIPASEPEKEQNT